jgi:hypothetical protein
LSVDGYCRGGADRAVREIGRIVLLHNTRRDYVSNQKP